MPIQDGSRLQLGEVLMTFRGPTGRRAWTAIRSTATSTTAP